MQDALAANERINSIFEKSPSIKSGEIEKIYSINIIKFENVSLKYDDLEALKYINLLITH